jgi:hypothetical protein
MRWSKQQGTAESWLASSVFWKMDGALSLEDEEEEELASSWAW